MNISTLEQLFVEEVRDLLDAEKQVTQALPKLINTAKSTELAEGLSSHLDETKAQIQRLNEVCDRLGVKAGRKRCAGMQGIIEEANKLLEEVDDDDTLDAAIICAAQKVEHYEMAVYGCLRTWATILGHDDIVASLQESLDEEGEADKTLSRIAESLNMRAGGVSHDDSASDF